MELFCTEVIRSLLRGEKRKESEKRMVIFVFAALSKLGDSTLPITKVYTMMLCVCVCLCVYMYVHGCVCVCVCACAQEHM